MNPEYIFFGCGGHSRSVSDILLLNTPDASIIYVDENAAPNETLFNFPVLKTVDYEVSDAQYVIAIGDNKKRKEKFLSINNAEKIFSVVSKFSHIGRGASYGIGTFIGNYAHIGPLARIGMNTIINTAAIVEHEVIIGDHSHIGPNSTISGRCKIGNEVFIGVGATVKDYISVCNNVIIGAGATVVKNISISGIYVGTPAKLIKGL
jgi:sugar O-acyltransferase (sialic acid O-acetyltransferase NeuD family)